MDPQKRWVLNTVILGINTIHGRALVESSSS
jgi:hypothetical protein